MKALMAGLVAMVVIAIAAHYLLNEQAPLASEDVFSSPNVRLD